MALGMDIVLEVIDKLTPNDQIELIKKHLSLDSYSEELEVSITPAEANGMMKFEFYGKSIKINFKTILENLPEFRENLLVRILDAKKDQDYMNIVFEEHSSGQSVKDHKEFIQQEISKCDNEEELSALFEHDFALFKEYYNSPERRSQDDDTRSFLLDIYNNHFEPIWEK